MCAPLFTHLPSILPHIKTLNRVCVGFVSPTVGRVDVQRGEVIGLQLARRWLSWGKASDMDHRGVAIKDALMRRRVSGWKPTAITWGDPPLPSPSLNPPQSCDGKPSCFQIVWFRWLPHKQPIEASEKFSVKWPILIGILEVPDRKYGIHRPSIIMDVWSQEARVETVWDGPAWDSQCYTHYTVGQSEEGRQSHTWVL